MSDDIIKSRSGYLVPSASHPGYYARVLGSWCSCPAGERRSCRHRRLVAELVKREDEAHRRPSVPVDAGLLCD